MKENHLPLDRKTYTALLTAHTKSKDSSLLDTLEEMKTKGIKPNLVNYNTVLEGLANEGNVNEQLRIKKEMIDSGEVLDATSYYHIVRGMCNDNQLQQAIQTLKEAQPNSLAAYAYVIQACTQINKAKAAASLLKAGEEAGIDFKPKAHIYLEVLRASAWEELTDVVIDTWEKTKSFGVRPDEGTLLRVLSVASKAGNTNLATDVIRQLSTSGYPYKEHYFTPLMEAFLVNDDLKNAFHVLDIMRVSGIAPTKRAAVPILKKLGQNVDAIDRAYYVLEEMKKENRAVDITAFNAVVQACAEARDIERTVATYREAANLGLEPNIDTYNAVLTGCVKTRMKGMGKILIDEMKKAGISPNLETYSKMIELDCTQRQYEDAFTYLEEMKSYDIIPPESCYIHLAKKLTYENDSRLSMLVQEMETFGYSIPEKNKRTWAVKKEVA